MDLVLKNVTAKDVDLYIKMGNEAIKRGHQDESVKWYLKGLEMAREQRNAQQEKEISNLIITII